MNTKIGLEFIPKYIFQDSDLQFGETVTHENYNEKLNLNTTQGDYNTYVLFKLLNGIDPNDTYHIPYLDAEIESVREDISDFENRVKDVEEDNKKIKEDMSDLDVKMDGILDGSTKLGHAEYADAIYSGLTAGPNKYYGTDKDSNLDFIDLPEFLYATDIGQSAHVEGIYFVPAIDSVTEAMLSPELRLKVNREAITDYNYLTNLPTLNGITIRGSMSLTDFGLQPVGDYVTEQELNDALSVYSTTTETQQWVNNNIDGRGYALQTALNQTNNTLSSVSNTATNAYNRAYSCARVGINAYPPSPQNGDIYFAV